MSHRSRLLVCALLLMAVARLPASAGLLEYVAKPDPAYQWSKIGEQSAGILKVTDLAMTSQQWQGITWKHTIRIFSPPQIRNPQAMVLVIAGGNPGPIARDNYLPLMTALATSISEPVAILYNIPNQPLFGGLQEDYLIAYTFDKYLQTGDETWPLLLPMTKSAVRAMDTLQAFAQQEWQRDLTSFVVTGASKRGWTTWLTGAADPKRVAGIAPMVIDTLNLPTQMAHQIETWGKYSASISEYTERGIQGRTLTPQGVALLKLVDPYTFLDRITMPKLIINGANDQYWVIDALNFYWGEVKPPKWVLYVPNATHGLEDVARLANTLIAFVPAVTGGPALPAMSWEHGDADGKVTLDITADPKPVAARIWVNRSQDMDFRDNRWEPTPMTEQGSAFVGSIAKSKTENMALFGEAEFNNGGRTFTLSTQVRVVPLK